MNSEFLGYSFKDLDLLKKALTHPSLCKTSSHGDSYERLEFLGDSVLSLVITEILVKRFTDEDEGKLAKRKAYIVSGEILANISKEQNLSDKLYMTDSEEKSGGRNNPHTLENVLEALIGAIYLDSDFQTIREIIKSLWMPYIENMKEVPIDSKSKLQEVLQSRNIPLPHYKHLSATGPKHSPSFQVSLAVTGFREVIAEGKTKQQAEKEAAKLMLEQIND